MEKALTHLGNSFAIVVDRAICKLLGLGHGSIVKMTVQDGRLIIERTGKRREPSPRAQSRPGLPQRRRIVRDPHVPILQMMTDEYSVEDLKKYGAAVVMALGDRGLVQYLDRIHYRVGTTFRELVRQAGQDPATAAEIDVVLLRRLRAVWDTLSHGGEWDEAIESAIARYPWPAENSEDMSAGTGAVAETMPPSG